MTKLKSVIVGLVLVAGCGFEAVGGDMGKGGSGGSGGSGSGGTGGSGGGGSGGSGGTGGSGGSGGSMDMGLVDTSCATPTLIVTVDNTTNNGTTVSGELLRFSLAGGGFTPCATLKGQGLLGAQLQVSTALDSGMIVTSDFDDVYGIDVAHDLVMWHKPAAATANDMWGPLEAFTIADGSGKPMAAIATALLDNPASMTVMDTYYDDGSEPASAPWCMSSNGGCMTDLALGLGILGVMADPITPAHFYAVDNTNNIAAREVDPSVPNTSTFIAGNADYLQVSYAIAVGGKLRMAWLNANNGSPPTSVDFYNDTGGTATVEGPLKCASGCTTFTRVVPDPTSATAFLLLCQGAATNGNSVVRLASDGTCTTLFNGNTLPDAYRLEHLAIAQ